MHGMEHLQAKAPDDSPLCSPNPGFPGTRINASWLAACFSSARNRSARNGFSLARNGCRLSAASIPGSMLPACSFAVLPSRFRVRSAPSSTTTCPGLLRWRLLLRLGPVTLPLPGPACRTALPPLPSGNFISLGIKAFSCACCLPGPPDESARSPFAPRCPFLESWGFGSPFQGRYVSAGLLFLKPLGTFSTMLLVRCVVNFFL